jgi:glutamate 5-kinase
MVAPLSNRSKTMKHQSTSERQSLTTAKRIVVKVGSKVILKEQGQPDALRMQALCEELGAFQKKGYEMSLVSSGAVGAGLDMLDVAERPTDIADLQMAAAIGQLQLMGLYGTLFETHACGIGQVLLTHDVLKDHERHLNARNTLLHLISHKIIPIINENDTISTEEIKFGDNDVLAALVAILIDADALILLSTTDGLQQPMKEGNSQRVSMLSSIDSTVFDWVSDRTDTLSTGGMKSKLQSAELAAQNGIPVIIADGRRDHILEDILAGADVGTLICPKERSISTHQKWIAFFNRAEGVLHVEEETAVSLRAGASLHSAHITQQEGIFGIGAMVEIMSNTGERIGRGLVEIPSDQLASLRNEENNREGSPVIHGDNLVLFT